MTKVFYLNDCLPEQPEAGGDVSVLFRQMVLGYKNLRKKDFLKLDQFWVTGDFVDNVSLCNVKLRDLLGQFRSEPVLFSYASRLVESRPPLIFAEEQLSDDPELGQECLCNNRDAHNLLIAQKLDMIAATLPVEQCLCVDALDLIIEDKQTCAQTVKQINNWYLGNNESIIQLLTPPFPSVAEPLDRLKSILGRYGNVYISQVFRKDWDVSGIALQQLIVHRFEDAINGGLLFPAKDTNKKIVKPDEVDKTSKVHELRQVGSGFRLYFECDDDAIYIALLASKTIHHGKDQAADFKIAKGIVERMRQGIM